MAKSQKFKNERPVKVTKYRGYFIHQLNSNAFAVACKVNANKYIIVTNMAKAKGVVDHLIGGFLKEDAFVLADKEYYNSERKVVAND